MRLVKEYAINSLFFSHGIYAVYHQDKTEFMDNVKLKVEKLSKIVILLHYIVKYQKIIINLTSHLDTDNDNFYKILKKITQITNKINTKNKKIIELLS